MSQTKSMSYYNYHGVAKKLIACGHCTHAIIKRKHNSISPALVLYFDNHKPMPIREKCFNEYLTLLKYFDVVVMNQLNKSDS